MPSDQAMQISLDLLDYIKASPTAAHAVANAAAQLDQVGFTRLDEGDPWTLSPGAAFYVQRGYSALVAGRVGGAPPAEAGLRLIGAHVDSPGLRLKPRAHYSDKGYLQLGVEVYGGPILSTWMDRDLTLAGKLFVQRGQAAPKVVLVHGDRPLCRVPLPAIHFNREVNDKGMAVDKQKHLPLIYALGETEHLEPAALIELFADSEGLDPNAVVAADFEVVDCQAPSIGGLDRSMLFSPRIDNLAGCHAALKALIAASADSAHSSLIALFDAEEVGSQTVAGAGSSFLDTVLERMCMGEAQPREALFRALAKSVLVSVDGAHAVHPNFSDYHDPRHAVRLNQGPVIKVNAQQRYATSAQTAHWFERCAARAEVPVQHYVHRTDLPCGSTIGPMTATRLGVATVDVGNAMLAMHSIRETSGTADQLFMIRALGEHLREV